VLDFMNYIKEIFNPMDLKHAKDIVLSPDSKDPGKFEADIYRICEASPVSNHQKVAV